MEWALQLRGWGGLWGCSHMEERHLLYRGIVMRHHSTRALICDGPLLSTTL